MKPNLTFKLIFAVILAFTVSVFVYFSFANVYSSVLFNPENFQKQYYNGIYRYRILSSAMLDSVYTLIQSLPVKNKVQTFLWDKSGDSVLYLSFAILNTFFTMLSAAVMVLITESKNFVASGSEKILLVVASLFAIIITQFVIVPYDCSSYFFLLLFFAVLLKYMEKETWSTLAVLILIMVVSSLNRESSALSISLAATLLFSKYGLHKKSILPVFWLALSFMAVYFGVRIYFGVFSTNDSNLLFRNFTLYRNLFGILFWVVFFTLSIIIAKDKTAVRNIFIFHLFAIPYILMCFYAGILYEARLYVPLFLTSLFLGRTAFQRIG